MVPIKIECECGQRYAFEVEPINGKMPSAVACPCCGEDGTAAANKFISRQLSPTLAAPPPIAQPGPEEPLEIPARPGNSPMAGRRDPRLGLVDRNQAEHEARAKVMWGDSREQVVSYLMIQGFSHPEATDMADNLFLERSSTVRTRGIGKIIKGGGLLAISAIAIIIFLSAIAVSTRLLGIAIVTGIYGTWLLINGILMAVAPKSEKGDVAGR